MKNKTAEMIEMPFGVLNGISPRKHGLNGGPDPPWDRAILVQVYFSKIKVTVGKGIHSSP